MEHREGNKNSKKKERVVVYLLSSSDEEETEDDDEDEVEFLFQRNLVDNNNNNNNNICPQPSKVKRKKRKKSSLVPTTIDLSSSSSSSCSTNTNTNTSRKNVNIIPKRPIFKRRFHNNVIKNRQSNPKPYIPAPSKRTKYNNKQTDPSLLKKYGYRGYGNLESEQEKLFGAAKKKMDEEIKTGVLPQSNSQMPRAKVPYHDRIGSQSSIGGGKKMIQMIKHHYKELGLKNMASLKQVKKAFRKLALTVHPDKYKIKDVNETVIRLRNAKWIRISTAYRALCEFLKEADRDGNED